MERPAKPLFYRDIMSAEAPISDHPPPPARQVPLVTVVMATYNRSNILRYSVETVRRQTVTDWELLVVGDACTDDTADVVSAFGDGRIRFWNLDQRHGEQSGPTNAACADARGRYVAILNHDDLWMPRHLERACQQFESHPDLDLVYGLNVSVQPDGTFRLRGPSPTGRYEEHAGIPASSWVLRRALLDRVGPWRAAQDIYNQPSQDWLRRAKRAGARMQLIPRLSVVSLPSGNRVASYADRASIEHERWFTRMTGTPDADAIEALLSDVAVDLDLSSHSSASSLAVGPFVRRGVTNIARRLLRAVGVSAHSLAFALRYRRRGGFINHLRRVRGLDPLPRRSRE